MKETLLSIKDLSFAYETERPVLTGINLELNGGERVAVIGPNGAGKSTLLYLITGLLHPSRGTIEVFGTVRSQEKDFIEVRSRAGLLFQDPEDQLFCPTVLEDVAFGPLNLGKSRGETLDAVRETLIMLGLSGYENRVTYRLSGGEKRLVSLATILVMQPDILLLDEPTANLDPESTEGVLLLLESLPQAMLIVTHDREIIARLAHRSVYLHNGIINPKP